MWVNGQGIHDPRNHASRVQVTQGRSPRVRGPAHIIPGLYGSMAWHHPRLCMPGKQEGRAPSGSQKWSGGVGPGGRVGARGATAGHATTQPPAPAATYPMPSLGGLLQADKTMQQLQHALYSPPSAGWPPSLRHRQGWCWRGCDASTTPGGLPACRQAHTHTDPSCRTPHVGGGGGAA